MLGKGGGGGDETKTMTKEKKKKEVAKACGCVLMQVRPALTFWVPKSQTATNHAWDN